MNYGIILMTAGAAIMIFSRPNISQKIMSRLFNEGLVTPRRIKPEQAEMISGVGPALSIFAIGFVTFFTGLIIFLVSP